MLLALSISQPAILVKTRIFQQLVDGLHHDQVHTVVPFQVMLNGSYSWCPFLLSLPP